ncbi:hypothetical protein CONPUDRAFT_143656 [Coniophora puteana RWD-64-598 SS2]|uniref:Uncharacterized protein n=1 Tax=Coniophora puteana (strain RWD-64-598) TaxID=741705 RepID=A0A5M3MSM4_CONPW|nr:uncharacterized protein CONPUDRAFT_143656 [Coniophora puteana RWD-64-598 SS2]EIW82173.1 hypothetical protein CONPUDRAFT_143656 [Coniophora puteana RWD-64-598 SS2]
MPTLQRQSTDILSDLRIPSEFTAYEKIAEVETLRRLEEWKARAQEALQELREMLVRLEGTDTSQEIKEGNSDDRNRSGQSKRVRDDAAVIQAVAPFAEEELGVSSTPWTTPSSRAHAQAILAPYDTLPAPLALELLTLVKPIFAKNLHPRLHPETARALARPAGGDAATQDYFEAQEWKKCPGIGGLLAWILTRMEAEAYERAWPLVIPPMMAFIDDYEPHHKLAGVRIVARMLERVPPELLRRTGLDALLNNSLSSAFRSLHSDHTPDLLRATVPTLLLLTDKSTSPATETRAERLSAIIGDGLIGTVWTYAYRDPETLAAATEMVAVVVQRIGIGAARWLKAIIPQLTHALAASANVGIDAGLPTVPMSRLLQVASAQTLAIVVEVCAPRMGRWRYTILDGVGRCWISLEDRLREGEKEGPEEDVLRIALKGVVKNLQAACEETTKDLVELCVFDDHLFAGLLPSTEA